MTVTDLGDSGPGTLRQAVADAAPGDTVDFAVTGTIPLSSGELAVVADLIVQGPGAASLQIQASGHRIWHVVAGALQLSGVSVGPGFDANRGAGAYVEPGATLMVSDCVFSDNQLYRPDHSGPATVGGAAIYNAGVLQIARSTFRGNVARGALGFAASIDAAGGALHNAASGIATVVETTFSDNAANGSTTGSPSSAGHGYGGGIHNAGAMTLTNSTLSANQAVGGSSPFAQSGAGRGGGLRNSGTVELESCTLTGNIAQTDGQGFNAVAEGGGLYDAGSGSTQLHASLVARNEEQITCAPPSCSFQVAFDDCAGSVVTNGYNLIGTNTGCSGPVNGVNGDQVGGSGPSSIDPMLGPLANNGGPTQTHALLASSPAIDTGDPGSCLATDQRGAMRPADGNNDTFAVCDIGAYEAGALIVPTPTPTETSTETPTLTPTPTATPICAVTPLNGCRQALRAALRLTQMASPTSRHLRWAFTDDAPSDFGNPVNATSYGFCLYDGNALVGASLVPAGAGWRATGSGYVYAGNGSAAGLVRLRLRSTAVRTRIRIRGAGADLPFALPLSGGAVTAQLVKNPGSGDDCWESPLPPPARQSTSIRFVDRVP